MQGMMRLYARNVIFFARHVMFFANYCCTRPIFENFALTTNLKSMLKLVYFFYFLVLAVLYFFPGVSNFLRGCSNHENISKKMDTWMVSSQI